VILDSLTEGVRQAGEAPDRHPHRQPNRQKSTLDSKATPYDF
jgi:hypothetical protein